MKYEAHITFFEPEEIPSRQLNRLMDVSERLGGKILMIQLLSTEIIEKPLAHPPQVMFTRNVELYSDGEAENWINYIGRSFVDAEFKPVRVKLEAQIESPGHAKYYESHWKVSKPPAINFGSIYFSRSIQDRTKFWATARSNGTNSLTSAHIRFDDVQTQLGKYGLFQDIEKKNHRERVVIDTNPGLDTGWAAQ